MLVWGVDGCASGWIGVRITAASDRDFTIVRNIQSLDASEATMVYIDIPIGLPETGYRGCDQAARRLLRGAQSRVFLGLRRPLLRHLGNYAAANAWAKSDGKGLAKQSFAILPKIAEIDAFISVDRQRSFRESHPELVFGRLNGGTALVSKHKPEGLRARQDILVRHGFADIDRWLGRLRGTGAKPDDLLDACVLALAAQEAAQGSAQQVKCPELRDAKGLRMDIWF